LCQKRIFLHQAVVSLCHQSTMPSSFGLYKNFDALLIKCRLDPTKAIELAPLPLDNRKGIKVRMQCFSMQVVLNKCFLLNREKSRRRSIFSFSRKTHNLIPKNDVTELRARRLGYLITS